MRESREFRSPVLVFLFSGISTEDWTPLFYDRETREEQEYYEI
jgi:hypothetical protein